jgi:hypothetical protein
LSTAPKFTIITAEARRSTVVPSTVTRARNSSRRSTARAA